MPYELPDYPLFHVMHWRAMEDKLTNRQKQALETKARIYESAVELFLEQPYDQVKIADICDKAGVSVGVFYHYFPSKGHVFNEGYASFEKELRTYLEGTDEDPIRTIELAVEKYMESSIKKGPAYRCVFLKNQLEIKDSQTVRAAMKSVLRAQVSAAVAEGSLRGDPAEITATLLHSLRGCIFDWAMEDGSFPLQEEGLKITRIILDHYRAEHTGPDSR